MDKGGMLQAIIQARTLIEQGKAVGQMITLVGDNQTKAAVHRTEVQLPMRVLKLAESLIYRILTLVSLGALCSH